MSIYSGQWTIWWRQLGAPGRPRRCCASALVHAAAFGLLSISTTSAIALAEATEPRTTMIAFSIKDLLIYLFVFVFKLVTMIVDTFCWARNWRFVARRTTVIADSWHWVGTMIAGAMIMAIPFVSPVDTVVGEVQGFGVRTDADNDVTGFQMDVGTDGGSAFRFEIDQGVFATLKVGDLVRVSYYTFDSVAVLIDVLDGPRRGMGWTAVPNAYLMMGGVPLLVAAAYRIGLKVVEIRNWFKERRASA